MIASLRSQLTEPFLSLGPWPKTGGGVSGRLLCSPRNLLRSYYESIRNLYELARITKNYLGGERGRGLQHPGISDRGIDPSSIRSPQKVRYAAGPRITKNYYGLLRIRNSNTQVF